MLWSGGKAGKATMYSRARLLAWLKILSWWNATPRSLRCGHHAVRRRLRWCITACAEKLAQHFTIQTHDASRYSFP